MKNLMQTAPIIEGKEFEGLMPETQKYLPTIGIPEEEVEVSSFDDFEKPQGAQPLEVIDTYEIMAPSESGSDSGSNE